MSLTLVLYLCKKYVASYHFSFYFDHKDYNIAQVAESIKIKECKWLKSKIIDFDFSQQCCFLFLF